MKEFPWLWRLDSDWITVNCQCVVIDPSPRVFRERTELHLDYWVHGLTASGNMAVRHIGKGTGNTNLAEYSLTARSALGMDYSLAGIAMGMFNERTLSLVKVIRLPKNESFQDLCLRIVGKNRL